MAPTLRKKNEKSHVFKIIVDDSMDQHKLGIPSNFVQNYGDDLSSSVKFKVPGGSEWKMEIVKSEGEIWFGNGWREFAEYYSVVEGSFLVFQYQKSSCEFNVIISNNGDQERADDTDQEQAPQEPNSKKSNLESSAETLDQSRLTGNRKEFIEKGSKCKEQKPRGTKQATKMFTSANPSFQAKIPPTCVYSGMAYVPYSITSKIEPGKESVMLKFNDRCWYVKLIRYSETRSYLSAGWPAFVRENALKVGDVCNFELTLNTDETPLFKVSIIRDLEQTTPDIPDEVFGQFSSSRKRKEKSTLSSVNSQPRKKTKRAENLTKKAGKGNSKESIEKGSTRKERKLSFSNPPQMSTSSRNPFFQVVMKSSHLRRRGYNMNVPLHFIKNLQLGTRDACFQVDDKIWSVKLIIYAHFAKSVFSGWTRFAMDNALEVGDVCSFEMIDPQKLHIKVSISRDSNDVEF